MRDAAHNVLVAILVQAVLYGVYIVTLLHCLRWLLFTKKGWRLRRKVNWPMLVISMNLFLLETTGLGVNFAKTFGYVTNRSQSLLVQLGAADVALKHSAFLFVDGVLIFRCWLFYSQNWHIVYLPLLLWLSCLLCPLFYINCYVPNLSFGQSQSSTWGFLLSPSIATFFGCHIASNVYATSAIIYRITHVALQKRKTYWHITRHVLEESGILYTLSSILSYVAHVRAASNNSPFAIFHTILDPLNFCVAGISINLILVCFRQAAEEDDIPLFKARELLETT